MRRQADVARGGNFNWHDWPFKKAAYSNKRLFFLLLSKQAQAQISEGTVVKGAIQIGSRSFALPPGDWTVLATDEGAVALDGVDKRGVFRRVYVVQTNQKNQLVAAIVYQATLGAVAGVASWTADPCKRTDTLHRDTLDGNFRFPACLLVNHITNFFNPDTQRNPFDLKVSTWLTQRAVVLPYAAIMSEYAKYGPGDYVVARIWMNPEAAGVEPTSKESWQNSPWNPRLIAAEPAHAAYVEKVKEWDSVFVASVRESFMGSKTASIALPPLPGIK